VKHLYFDLKKLKNKEIVNEKTPKKIKIYILLLVNVLTR